MAPPNSRLNKDSAAVYKLREMFESNQFTGTEDPKQAWLSHPLFQEHKLSNFRTCYKNIKTEYTNNDSRSKWFFKFYNLSYVCMIYNINIFIYINIFK